VREESLFASTANLTHALLRASNPSLPPPSLSFDRQFEAREHHFRSRVERALLGEPRHPVVLAAPGPHRDESGQAHRPRRLFALLFPEGRDSRSTLPTNLRKYEEWWYRILLELTKLRHQNRSTGQGAATQTYAAIKAPEEHAGSYLSNCNQEGVGKVVNIIICDDARCLACRPKIETCRRPRRCCCSTDRCTHRRIPSCSTIRLFAPSFGRPQRRSGKLLVTPLFANAMADSRVLSICPTPHTPARRGRLVQDQVIEGRVVRCRQKGAVVRARFASPD